MADRIQAPTVIVPTLGAGSLAALLSSLGAQSLAHDVIVVDNGTSGDGVRSLCRGFDFVEVIRAEANLGFSAAVNLAARSARGDAIVLVNDDAECDPGFVEAIVSPFGADPGTVMVAGVMRSEAAPELIDSAGVALDPSLLSIDYLNGEPISAVHDAPPPVGPSGAAAAYRRDAFAAAGGFDERIFAYWEDVDLALRLRSAGGRCALAPDALGTHRHAGTLGSGSPRKNYLMGFGRGYLLRKWGVLRTRHAPAALLRDLATWAGQAALDRNLGGFRGWIGGIRAARGSAGYPRWLAAEPSLAVTGSPLRRRLARRLRIRGAR